MGNCFGSIHRKRSLSERSEECDKKKFSSGSESAYTSERRPTLVTNMTVRALYDYAAREDGDLGFKKGDKMKVLRSFDADHSWWVAKHLRTRQQGTIPSNFVTADDNQDESQDWWFDLDRREADKQLILPGNPRGTFLIRKSAKPNSFALSVRDFDDTHSEASIKHYRIRSVMGADGTLRLYIIKRCQFISLVQLVQYYTDNKDGLCCPLAEPCSQVPETVPFKQLEVPRSDIRLEGQLGAGKFGTVWKGTYKNSHEVAVKQLKPGSMTFDAFVKEAVTLHQLRHRKLVQLMGVCTVEEPIYIITELMANGDLLNYLRKDCGAVIGLLQMLDMCAQIADGMAYLEEKNYVHRDLRAANILVGENYTVKVADFGLAQLGSTNHEREMVQLSTANQERGMARLGTANQENGQTRLCIPNQERYQDPANTMERIAFPVRWTAPEAFTSRQFNTKSDVWSYGVVIYEIVTFGEMPYRGKTHDAVKALVANGERLARPSVENFDCPIKLYETMTRCWGHIPDDRPTFSQLTAFFSDYYLRTEQNGGEGANDEDDEDQ